MKKIIEINDGNYRCNCDLCGHFNKSGIHYLISIIDENESKKEWRQWTRYHGLFFSKYVINKELTKIILLLYLTNSSEMHENCPLISFLMNNE